MPTPSVLASAWARMVSSGTIRAGLGGTEMLETRDDPIHLQLSWQAIQASVVRSCRCRPITAKPVRKREPATSNCHIRN